MVKQVKTSDRRVSNIDRLKQQLASRMSTMHGGKAKARLFDDDSDDSESSDDDDSDDESYGNTYSKK